MVLDEVSLRAVSQCFPDEIIVIESRQDQDFSEVLFHDLFGRFDTIHDRHLDVHEENIRLILLGDVDRLTPVTCAAKNLKIIIHIEDDLHAISYKITVICNNDFYFLHV